MLSQSTFTVKGVSIWLICASFFLYEFFLRTVLGAFQEPLMHDLHLQAFQFSLLSSSLFLLVYSLMQIPVGLILDYFGLKRALLLGIGICTAFTLAFAFSAHYYFALLMRMGMGLGAAFGFVGLLLCVYEWLPKAHRGLFIGLSQFIGTIGPMLSTGPLMRLVEYTHASWRSVFIGLSLIGALIGILTLLFVENKQQQAAQYIVLKKPEKIRHMFSRLFHRAQPWWVAFISAGLYCPVEYFSENEGRFFLHLKGISLHVASDMLSLAWLGYAIGAPCLGSISDRISRRRTLLIFSALCSILALSGIVYTATPLWLYSSFFLLGISASGQTIGYANIVEQMPSTLRAVALSLNNTIITLVTASSAPIIGAILDHESRHHQLLEKYQMALNTLIVMSLLISLSSIFFLKETFGKSQIAFNILNPKSVHH